MSVLILVRLFGILFQFKRFALHLSFVTFNLGSRIRNYVRQQLCFFLGNYVLPSFNVHVVGVIISPITRCLITVHIVHTLSYLATSNHTTLAAYFFYNISRLVVIASIAYVFKTVVLPPSSQARRPFSLQHIARFILVPAN